MEKKTEAEVAIFYQICEVNDLDPQLIKEEAKKNSPGNEGEDQQAEHLIRTAFRYRANALVVDLGIDLSSGNGSISEGKEYNADGDPAAPSFTINDEFIRKTYSAEEAEKMIAALGGVQLPIRA